MKHEYIKILEKLTFNTRDLYTNDHALTTDIIIHNSMMYNEITGILKEFSICAIIKTHTGARLTLVHKNDLAEWYNEN